MKEHYIFSNNIDDKALSQFYDALKQPFVVKGALMPDAHAGYALPIGAVVATDGVVVPAWVGYDIGCTDCETEFLSESGWKKISEYSNDKIAVFDKNTRSVALEYPEAFIVNNCDSFYLLDNKVTNQALTGDHKVLLYSSDKKSINTSIENTLSYFLNKNNELSKGVSQQFETTFSLESKDGLSLTNDEIKLIVAISADATIRHNSKVEFHLKKPRKIARLKNLLNTVNLQYSESLHKDGTYSFTFYWSKAVKSLNIFWKASSTQLDVLTKELQYWDGHYSDSKDTIYYYSTDKDNIDLVQYAFAVNGIRANFCKTSYEDKNWKDTYQLYTTKNTRVCFPKPKNIYTMDSVDGKSYCFNTSTGFWVMRRNGKITITGNCGMLAVQLDLKKDEIVNYLDYIFESIYDRVPVGYNHHKIDQDITIPLTCTDRAKKIIDEKNWKRQIGTLGGGNHFIEIGYDEADNVWIIVHSGSRGVGHGIATEYMKLASNSTKAKEGHYGLDIATTLGMDYRIDVQFCQDYALENREKIVEHVIQVLYETIVSNFSVLEKINRNHNHVEFDGKYWIHRKGATHAEFNMLGVIPGNMRDGSFIVRGLGNKDSLCSSSHGAGRVLGRRAAKESLKLEDFEKDMVGIVAKVDESTLDESSMAYKDIFKVMEDQKDLVEVMHHIKPLLNIKG